MNTNLVYTHDFKAGILNSLSTEKQRPYQLATQSFDFPKHLWMILEPLDSSSSITQNSDLGGSKVKVGN